MKGLLCAESLNLDLVNMQVMGCRYRQTCAYSHIATVHILEPFFLGGGPKSILLSLFWNKKASARGIYTLIDIHIGVFFNTESLNVRDTHFKSDTAIYLY